ncbi:methyltransferase domain-containing protein [Pseudanabaena galeata UHCC 0370]|uniref:Methyltransferase domain-containing protein n=1 Tax=Pseudanabaena galeata UHCC 0370 TaxID=3110310 RepID=A0ABU5TLC0_9CYAN|nr:methyltransferase domain-containing protein [Pseudanabaena galeata]MEA5478902.1 methyltransferase domain-containing protein [Pseudanabaena galeata UHCC 0370]
MANLLRLILRFVLIAAITSSTLLACNSLMFNNSTSSSDPLENKPENKPLPPLPTMATKDIEPERIPDAPYVQTPPEVVLKMLEMAKVDKNDVVYDLGSGDGRIVITAAQKFGAKAIGIEIDPELIRESDRESKAAIAKTPEIRDRIKFIKQDLFKADLSDATVITLYLLPLANLRVRSEILPKLKSGTRVVSHEYNLGDLPPKQIEKVKVGNREHRIYLWILDR